MGQRGVLDRCRNGTIQNLVPVLDHLAETGVNGVWVSPPLNGGNGYGNFGIHTMSSRLIGETDRQKQWQALKTFVDEAHKRNIRVFFDVINWGVTKHEGGAPILKEKPEWFGEYFHPYRGYLFNWENKELNEWFTSRLTEWLLMTGVDGFRCDCAPQYAGFAPYGKAKERLRRFGRKVIFMSEWICSMPGRYSMWLLRLDGSFSSRCFFSRAAGERNSESTKNWFSMSAPP